MPQPHGNALDLGKTGATIMAETEVTCRADPSFPPRVEWQKLQVARLA